MRSLEELIDLAEPGIDLVRDWVSKAEVKVDLLPPAASRADALLQTQVTTRSPMGAIVYETGGILLDDGWLRFLGSGHPRLTRSLPAWNSGRSARYYLCADDAVGGFFALNGGALGEDTESVYYWPPDDLEWLSLGMGYSDFLCWCLTDRSSDFYDDLRWPTWREDTRALSGDRCFSFYPFLWTVEGSVEGSHRRDVPVHEAFDSKVWLRRQIAGGDA